MSNEEALRPSIEAMNEKPFEGLKTISTEDIFKIAYIVHYIKNVEQTRYDKLKEAVEKIKEEIQEIVDKEIKEDARWGCGLRYSLKIIDKHTEGLV